MYDNRYYSIFHEQCLCEDTYHSQVRDSGEGFVLVQPSRRRRPVWLPQEILDFIRLGECRVNKEHVRDLRSEVAEVVNQVTRHLLSWL